MSRQPEARTLVDLTNIDAMGNDAAAPSEYLGAGAALAMNRATRLLPANRPKPNSRMDVSPLHGKCCVVHADNRSASSNAGDLALLRATKSGSSVILINTSGVNDSRTVLSDSFLNSACSIGIAAIGMDCPIQSGAGSHELTLIENLANLDAIPDETMSEFFAVPTGIELSGRIPARCFATCAETWSPRYF